MSSSAWTREEKIKDIAINLETVLAENQHDFLYQIPDAAFEVRYSGRIDLLKLAEWLFVRMG